MKTIRHNVFETNSSSSHSITIKDANPRFPLLNVKEDGYIYVMLRDFGWGYEVCDSQWERLAYLIIMAANSEDINIYNLSDDVKEQLYNCEEFKDLEDEICCYIGEGCKGIRISDDSYEAYIDHQSSWNSYKRFLESEGLTATEFVFGDVYIVVDNDNH